MARLGFDNELMTGWIDLGRDNPLSRITIASMADLGYVVNLNGVGQLAELSPGSASDSLFIDCSGDTEFSSLDVLLVINHINGSAANLVSPMTCPSQAFAFDPGGVIAESGEGERTVKSREPVAAAADAVFTDLAASPRRTTACDLASSEWLVEVLDVDFDFAPDTGQLS